ncbi:Molybdopterin-guanine dinucleotide biosynthesis protein MobA [hydrothermal vent metagenome]|uniref:Molybdopterin-guanine dinucleotide biosynthesis protein MobA n=1 Tax=hydrothermal vent metagenome TaxID=652676 RepID=A0A3B0SF49_9ZZZZ
MSKTLGVIIAGGQSQRFRDKSGPDDKFLAPFGSTTLLGHIIDRAKKQIPDVMLNVNGDPDRVKAYGLDIIPDSVADAGPLGGILAAMTSAKDRGYDHIISFSSDCPFFPDDYIARLSEGGEGLAIACSAGRPHPVMGYWPTSLADDLRDYLDSGERRVMWWVRRHTHREVVWSEKNPDPFFNINVRQDLTEAEKFL